MSRLTKEALLQASDLVEREVELPTLNGSVKVRSLSAAYSNQASSEALVMKSTPGGDQIATVDTARLEILQLFHGLVEPKLDSVEEAEKFAQQCGPAVKEIVRVIDDISGVDKEAIEEATARFQGGDGTAASKASKNGGASASAGGAGSNEPARPRAADGEKRA